MMSAMNFLSNILLLAVCCTPSVSAVGGRYVADSGDNERSMIGNVDIDDLADIAQEKEMLRDISIPQVWTSRCAFTTIVMIFYVSIYCSSLMSCFTAFVYYCSWRRLPQTAECLGMTAMTMRSISDSISGLTSMGKLLSDFVQVAACV